MHFVEWRGTGESLAGSTGATGGTESRGKFTGYEATRTQSGAMSCYELLRQRLLGRVQQALRAEIARLPAWLRNVVLLINFIYYSYTFLSPYYYVFILLRYNWYEFFYFIICSLSIYVTFFATVILFLFK